LPASSGSKTPSLSSISILYRLILTELKRSL
jgi:hypothetical protein